MDDNSTRETKATDNIVVDKGKFSWSDLWKLEDYWAIWLGAFLLIVGLLIFIPNPPADMQDKINKANATLQVESERAPFQTIAWQEANDAKGKLGARNEDYAKKISSYLARPKEWTNNPVSSLYLSADEAAAKRAGAAEKYELAKENTATALASAQAAEAAAEAAGFNDKSLNAQAEQEIAAWRTAMAAESKAKSAAETKPYNLLGNLAVIGIAFGLFFAIGTRFMGRNTKEFLTGFIFVFFLEIGRAHV